MLISLRSILFALLALTAFSAQALDFDELQQARSYFAGALDDDDDALDQAFDAFQELSQAHPSDALLLAYYGSTEAMQGGAAFWPWKKMELANAGMAKIDKALIMLESSVDERVIENIPVSLEARLVAISTFLAVPGFFNRLESADEAYQAAVQSPEFEQAPTHMRAQLWFTGAQIAERVEDKAEHARLLQLARNEAQASDTAGMSAVSLRMFRLFEEDLNLALASDAGQDSSGY